MKNKIQLSDFILSLIGVNWDYFVSNDDSIIAELKKFRKIELADILEVYTFELHAFRTTLISATFPLRDQAIDLLLPLGYKFICMSIENIDNIIPYDHWKQQTEKRFNNYDNILITANKNHDTLFLKTLAEELVRNIDKDIKNAYLLLTSAGKYSSINETFSKITKNLNIYI